MANISHIPKLIASKLGIINGSDVIDTSDKVWIVQNGKYLNPFSKLEFLFDFVIFDLK